MTMFCPLCGNEMSVKTENSIRGVTITNYCKCGMESLEYPSEDQIVGNKKENKVNCLTCKNFENNDCDFEELCFGFYPEFFSNKKDRPFYRPKKKKNV